MEVVKKAMANNGIEKQRFVEYLRGLPKDAASDVVCLLSIGAVRAARAHYSMWPRLASVVFNGTMLLFCKESLGTDETVDIINYGMQIEDLRAFTDDSASIERMCQSVETLALNILTRTATDSQ